jgi:hypothetical protein
MGVGSQNQGLATLPWERAAVPSYRRLDGFQEQSGQVRRGENLSPLPGFERWTIQPIVSHYANHHIPARTTDLSNKRSIFFWDHTYTEVPQWSKSITPPLCKTGNKFDCSNYPGISVSPNVPLWRLTLHAQQITQVRHCGFQCTRSTTDQILHTWTENGSTVNISSITAVSVGLNNTNTYIHTYIPRIHKCVTKTTCWE